LAASPIYAGIFKGSSPEVKKKAPPPMNLMRLVAKKDRLNSQHVVAYLKLLLDTHQRVQDPLDDIETIFNKILVWKRSFGDLDKQEKAVRAKLANSGKNKVQLHNVKTLRAKMQEIQQEVGLSDDEVTLIIFTSLDHDWLNCLLVLAGEFTKWFNINFEGEGRDEVDFRDNKHEIWLASVELAKMMIDEYAQMRGNQEEMLTQAWWQHKRFKRVGLQMQLKFKGQPQLLTSLRALFRTQDDKLSYFDLFSFLEHTLQIKLQNWEEDALEGRLDRLGMAFIEFNEFNEFCLGYGIDFGEPLLENDLEE